VDVAAALERPGVVAAYTAWDLGDYWKPGPLLVAPPPTIERLEFNTATHVPLARDKVKHVGEPIAMVVAESRYVAEDALADIVVDLEPLDAVVDIEKALDPEAPIIHDELATNLAAHVIQEKDSYEEARSQAHLVVRRRFEYDRGASAPMENRGIVARWDEMSQELTVWDTTQAPIPIRNGLAAMLGLLESQVRVIAPFIGGGFGPKIMMFYPEEVLLPWAAMRLGRPLKWIEDRQESFVGTTQERGQVHEAELALDQDGRILGVKDVFIHDSGAFDPYGLTVPINSQCTLLGPYEVPAYYSEFTVVFTNKTIVTPVRGAGRQHGVFVMERLLDFAARELGIDRVEIRRRNFIDPEAFPHDHKIIFQDSGRGAVPRPRRGSGRGAGHRLVCGGHGHRSLRGSACLGGTLRQGASGHRRRHPGTGPLHRVRPGGGRGARRERGRRPRDHGRHPGVPLGHGHLRQSGHRGGGERLPGSRQVGARQGAGARGAGARGGGRSDRFGGRPGVRVGRSG
jgi:CO/xanthine dehydrogenase Mo-binding subunit